MDENDIHVFLDGQMQVFRKGEKARALNAIKERCLETDKGAEFACRTFIWIRCVYFSPKLCVAAANQFGRRMDVVDQVNFKASFPALKEWQTQKPHIETVRDISMFPLLSKMHSPLKRIVDFSYTRVKHRKNPDPTRLLYSYYQSEILRKMGKLPAAAKNLLNFLQELKKRSYENSQAKLFRNVLLYLHSISEISAMMRKSEVRASWFRMLKEEDVPQ